MQTIEKALHQPMPFTTGGQTITDRLTAAKHSLAGSQLGKTICKATTEELMAPKKKHLDYLLHCTQEPNVSIPSMANLLIERTQNPNWTVVYKALITIHNIMCYGNERFSQYLASCNTTFNLGEFLDKSSAQGYDMSQHVRRYGKYISEKIYNYRLCAYDFCKVKRGREDGLLRTMNTDKLLKTLPILQNQVDALLEFQVTSAELNNGVINCSFILLFRDLIRLFACYNDGIINLLEKYFDMNKKQCREALDTYKSFLMRLDKVSNFLKVAESVGIDRTEIPDLTRAPASLLEALETHLIHLEGGRVPPAFNQEQFAAAMVQSAPLFSSAQTSAIDDSARQKYLDEEKERLRLYEEEQRKRQVAGMPPMGDPANSMNPFAPQARIATNRANNDLLGLFDSAPGNTNNSMVSGPANPHQALALDATNPFAQNIFQQQATSTNSYMNYPNLSTANAFGSEFPNAFGGAGGGAVPTATVMTTAQESTAAGFNPFLVNAPTAAAPATQNWPQESQQQWNPMTKSDMQAAGTDWANVQDDSSDSGDEVAQTGFVQPRQATAPVNPFGVAAQQNMQEAGMNMQQQQQQKEIQNAYRTQTSNAASVDASLLHAQMNSQQQQQPTMVAAHALGIYDQTPFSRTDGSYTSSPIVAHHHLVHGAANIPGGNAHLGTYSMQPPASASPAVNQQGKFNSGDLDSALSSLADNLSVSGKVAASQGKPVQWSNQPVVRPSVGPPVAQQGQYGVMSQQWPPYASQPGMYPQQQMVGMYAQPNYVTQMQQPQMYAVPHSQATLNQQASPAQMQRPFM